MSFEALEAIEAPPKAAARRRSNSNPERPHVFEVAAKAGSVTVPSFVTDPANAGAGELQASSMPGPMSPPRCNKRQMLSTLICKPSWSHVCCATGGYEVSKTLGDGELQVGNITSAGRMPVHRVRATAKHSESPSKLRSPTTPRVSTGSQDAAELRCFFGAH